jgi:hypothetical protein
MCVETLPSGFDHPRLEVSRLLNSGVPTDTAIDFYVRTTQATFLTILYHQVKAVFFRDTL